MLTFGERLRLVFKENDVNIYGLAKKTGVDRRSMYRMMDNSCRPNRAAALKLIDALIISKTERDDLLTALAVTLDGEFICNQRKQVHTLFNRVYEALSDVSPLPTPVHSALLAKTGCVSGRFSLNDAVDRMISREMETERPNILFYMPCEYAFFYDLLLLKSGALSAQCVFEFQKSAEITRGSGNPNIDLLNTLMPFIVRANGAFSAYYRYSSVAAPPSPVPYFVVTSRDVCVFASDLGSAFIYSDPDTREFYAAAFESARAAAYPLVKNITSMGDTVAHYSEQFEDKANGICGVGSHPCISEFLTRDILNAKFPSALPNRDAVLAMVDRVYAYMREAKNKLSVFTRGGLETFANMGIIETFDETFFSPFTLSERAEIFKRLCGATQSDDFVFRLADTKKLKIPSCFYAEVFEGSRINMVIGRRAGGEVNTVSIEESSIVSAFYDFLQSLPETDLVFDKDETLRVLNEMHERVRG